MVWLYKVYTPQHDNFITRYLKTVEYRQMISLLVVSKGYFETTNKEKGTYLTYYPKIRLKILFDTGQLVLEEPIDGEQYMDRFAKGEFDKAIELSLLADKQTSEFVKNKMISTFAFDPIKFRRSLIGLKPKKGVLQVVKGIDWKYDKFYNMLIAGDVGTGKSYMLFSVLGQLLAVTSKVYVADPKNSDLASLAYTDFLKGQVFHQFGDICALVDRYYVNMMKRSDEMQKFKRQGILGAYFEFDLPPYFLMFDEYTAWHEFGESLSYTDDDYKAYQQAMSQLNQIAMMGRELGFYIILGMQKPETSSLPNTIKNQLNFRVVMGKPSPEVEQSAFDGNEKQLLPLSQTLKGWGFLRLGNGNAVRAFFAPEVPRDFNLHEWLAEMAEQRKNVKYYQKKEVSSS